MDLNMKVIAIIPARYASTRFPGKPLAMLGGKTVIQRVGEQVSRVIDDVAVATDGRTSTNWRTRGERYIGLVPISPW